RVAMGKRKTRENPLAPEERAATAQIERNNGKGGDRAEQIAISAQKDIVDAPPRLTKAHPIPRNHRELALAIFAACDPAAVGCEVIDKSDDRGAATKLRA